MRAGSGSRRALVWGLEPAVNWTLAWGLNGPFGFSLTFFWVCILGALGTGAFAHAGGPLGGHQFIFSWPDSLLFDFWLFFFAFLCAFCLTR